MISLYLRSHVTSRFPHHRIPKCSPKQHKSSKTWNEICINLYNTKKMLSHLSHKMTHNIHPCVKCVLNPPPHTCKCGKNHNHNYFDSYWNYNVQCLSVNNPGRIFWMCFLTWECCFVGFFFHFAFWYVRDAVHIPSNITYLRRTKRQRKRVLCSDESTFNI